MEARKLTVAIDGPAGTGKSCDFLILIANKIGTIARTLGKQIGYVHVDTGAMYRSVTYKVLFRYISTFNA
jgi:cytidylate kinase